MSSTPACPSTTPAAQGSAADPLLRGIRLSQAALFLRGTPAALRQLASLDLTPDLLGGRPVLLEAVRIAGRFPSLRIIVDHLPFGEPLPPGALRQAAARRNLCAKISHLPRRRGVEVILDPAFYQSLLDPLLDAFGQERLISGSHWPVSDRTALCLAAFDILKPISAAKAGGRTRASSGRMRLPSTVRCGSRAEAARHSLAASRPLLS